MSDLVFLLEEESAKAMLEGLVYRLAPNRCPRYIVFEGKQDLDNNIKKKLKGYQTPEAIFIILRDQDSGDCKIVKKDLLRKIPANKSRRVRVCIACHELESFYLGDLAAVEKGLNISGLHEKQEKAKYRKPDGLANAKEELKRLTKNKYQPIAGSRAIASHLDLSSTNKSHSFSVLLKSIQSFLAKEHICNDAAS